MCELFGLSCDRETNIELSFTQLQQHSRSHPHGWGIAYYQTNGNGHNQNDGNHAVIIKEPNPAHNSSLANSMRTIGITSRIFISHIRYATAGAHISLNTHPFELSLDPRKNPGDGIKEQSWTFAHNGHVNFKRDKYGIIRDERFPLTDLKPHGTTDSEYAFCFIMEQLRKQYVLSGFQLSVERKAEIIVAAADEISNHYPNSLNFIMSDGDRLYCYYGGYNTLYFLKREGPLNITFLDPADGMKLQLEKGHDKRAVLIATKKLTDEDWKDVPNFMVVEGGTIMDSSDSHIINPSPAKNPAFSKNMKIEYGAAGLNAELGPGAIYCIVSPRIAQLVQLAKGNALTFDGVTIDAIRVYAWDERIANLFRRRSEADRYKPLVCSEHTILLSEKARKKIGKGVGKSVRVTVPDGAEVVNTSARKKDEDGMNSTACTELHIPKNAEKSLSKDQIYESVSAIVAKIRELCEVCGIRDAITSLDDLETFVSKYPESDRILKEHARAYVMIIERLGIAYKIDEAQVYLARLNELAKKNSEAVDLERARALVYMIDHSGWDDRIPLAEQYLAELNGHVSKYQGLEKFYVLPIQGMSHMVKHLARLGMFDDARIMLSNMMELAGNNPRLNEKVVVGLENIAFYSYEKGRGAEGIVWLGKLEDMVSRYPRSASIAMTWASAILGVAHKRKNNLGMEYVLKGLNAMKVTVDRTPRSKSVVEKYAAIVKYAVQHLCMEGRVDEAADKLEGLSEKFSTMDSIAISYYEGVSAVIQGLADCGRVDDAISSFTGFKAFIERHPCERVKRVLCDCAVDVIGALARDARDEAAMEMLSWLVGQVEKERDMDIIRKAAMRIVEGSCDFKAGIKTLGKLLEGSNGSEHIVRGALAGYGNIVVHLVEEGRMDDVKYCMDALKHLGMEYPGVTESQFVEEFGRSTFRSRDVAMNRDVAEILSNIKRFEGFMPDSEAFNCVISGCFSRIIDLLTDSQGGRGAGDDTARKLPEDDSKRILMIDKCLDEFRIFADKRHESDWLGSELSRLKGRVRSDAKQRLNASKVAVDADVIGESKKVSRVEGKHSMGSIGYKVKDEQGNTIRRYVFDHRRGRTWRVK